MEISNIKPTKTPMEGDVVYFTETGNSCLIVKNGIQYNLTAITGKSIYVAGSEVDLHKYLARYPHNLYPASEYTLELKQR